MEGLNLNERDFLASISDLIGTMHKIDAKVSKLHEVVIGDKEFGQEGVIVKLKNIEKEVEKVKGIDEEVAAIYEDVEILKGYKNKLVGFFIAGGVVFGFVWEMLKMAFKH